MTHTEWLDKITGGDSPRKIAAKTGIPFRTVDSQRSRNNISAENVIKIAVGYEVHPVGALVETGYLEAKYAKTIDPRVAARLLSEEELTDEVLYRLKLGTQTDNFHTPVDELAARRNSNTSPMYVAPLSDDEIADAIREANERPQAAHTDDGIEYTEPELP